MKAYFAYAFLIFTQSIYAQSLNFYSKTQGFNIITKSYFKAGGGQVEGPAAIGGDMILLYNTTIATNSSGTFPTGYLNNSGNYGLVINGKVIYTAGNNTQVNQGLLRLGDATGTRIFYKDCNNASTNMRLTSSNNNNTNCHSVYNSNPSITLQRQQQEGTVTNPSGIDFTAAFTYFNSYSFYTDLVSTMSQTTNCRSQFNTITIPTTSNPHIIIQNNKINYIKLTATQLNNLANQGSIIFDTKPSASSPLFIDVDAPSTFSWNTANLGGIGDQEAQYMLWNFSNTTTLNLNGNNPVYGTVLATKADVIKSSGSNFNGQIISNTLTLSSGAIRYLPFRGQLPDCLVALPVHMVSFTGKVTGNTATLNWDVAQNEDGSYFTVEKSNDGKIFTKAGIVYNSVDSGGAHYTFSEGINGKCYYRVKITNKDNSYTYSEVLYLTAGYITHSSLQVRQNPITNTLNFMFTTAMPGAATVRLYSGIGARVYQKQITVQAGDNLVNIPLNIEIPSGYYILELVTSSGRYTAKLVR